MSLIFAFVFSGITSGHGFLINPVRTFLWNPFASCSEALQMVATRKKTIALLTDESINKQIILPGETRTIFVADSFEGSTIKELTSIDNGIVAVGVISDSEEGEDLVEMASMCEIQNYYDRLVTVQCVGRIKLKSCSQMNPYWRFYFSLYEEDQTYLEECRLVADNIETFIQKLSKSEGGSGLQITTDGDEESLLYRFKLAYERSLEADHYNAHRSEEIRSLTAISWAAFIAVERDEEISNNNLYQYRLRALDYDTLFDRLKLAQYMLREVELRFLGRSMGNASYPDELWNEGFQ